MASGGTGKMIGVVVGTLALIAVAVWCAGTALNWWEGDGVKVALAEGNPEEMRTALLSLDEDKLEAAARKEAIDVAAQRMRDMSFAEVMDVMRAKGLSDEDKRRLREIGRDVFMSSVDRNVNEYMDAPKDHRDKIMDRHLDEWAELMAEMQEYREKHKDDPDAKEARESWGQRNRQSAKSRMEGGDPDQMKRMMFYWGQMMGRAKARGMDMGFGRGGAGKGKSGGSKGD